MHKTAKNTKKENNNMCNLITSNEVYLKGMRNTFHDKAWFMPIIPADVEVIIDFGCAGGDFIEYMKKICPQYQYFGIDNNQEFRKICHEKGITTFKDIDEVKWSIGNLISKSLIVMNSVLHEIYSYEPNETEAIWKKLYESGVKYIALRDMYAKGCALFNSKVEKEIMDVLGKDKCAASNSGSFFHINEKFEDFEKHWGKIYDGYMFTHFLLKYFYDLNWDRELQENYLPFHYRELHTVVRKAGYDITFESFYSLPWLKQKWMSDFDCDTHPHLACFIRNILTHMKLFIVKGDNI